MFGQIYCRKLRIVADSCVKLITLQLPATFYNYLKTYEYVLER